MGSSRKYSVGITTNKLVIHTEDIDTATKLLNKLLVPTLINLDDENAIDIRSIRNVIITIQLEGDIQKVKLKEKLAY
ncbi:hypothetical protein HNP65_000325 [Thermosipho japonicus]|uniref:Uncharacterized protein n=1 Tax=Thermosipho japonicus TaxID=90323 RepID=A0A841GQ28_9BACT|nr:hypothetical protein [Thermosipho japonicus]MBB6061903.1 hypothetical protein [Thermosipho japonicus]